MLGYILIYFGLILWAIALYIVLGEGIYLRGKKYNDYKAPSDYAPKTSRNVFRGSARASN